MENAEQTTGYYMVRAMASTERDFDVFWKNSVVAVGWSEIDLGGHKGSLNDLLEEVRKEYYSREGLDPRFVGRKLAQVSRFLELKAGDRVIVPYYDGVWLCTVTGERHFQPDASEADLCNQIGVDYQLDPDGNSPRVVMRDDLSNGLATRLRVRGSTVSDLGEFAKEIESMFTDVAYTWSRTQIVAAQHARSELKRGLLDRMRNGHTGLKAGGLGLERLVAALFEAEGYNAQTLGTRGFEEGDADVRAERPDPIRPVKVLAQVKHHDGITGRYGLDQLIQIKESGLEPDAVLALITSADLPEALVKEAQERDIATLSGEELAEWILARFDALGSGWHKQLGLVNLPRLVN